MRWLILLLFLFLARPARADELLFEDRFSTDFNWQTVRNAAHYDPTISCLTPDGIPEWKITDGTVEMQIAGSIPCSIEAVPNQESLDGQRAFRLSLKMYVSEPLMDRNLLIRWQDADNQLGIHIFGSGIFGYKYLNGQPQVLIDSERSYNFSKNRWYDVAVDYDLSLRRVQLYLDGSLALEMIEPDGEPQLERGKPGLAASVGEVDHSYVRFDDFRVESIGSETKLAVPFFSQTDPRWRNQQYDRAVDWSPVSPSIGRWGCALVSGVMVLRYLGITHLPDGTDLNPGTLNAWLIGQADGYFPGGNLNWRALTRLSHWHSQTHGTTELEMTYENPDDKLAWLKHQLDNARPVILEQPGHFVTAYGYGPGVVDIALHDPFYDRYRLSDYRQTYDSARLFTPSHTDLSAVTLVVPLGTKVLMTDANNATLTATTIIESDIQNPEFPTRFPSRHQVIDLPKPPEGTLLISLSANDSVIPLWIVAYDQQGRVSTQDYLLASESGQVLIPVTFSADVPPQIDLPTAPMRFDWWELTRLNLAQEIRSPALIPLILDYQSRLAEMNNLDEAEALERGWQLQLHTATKNGWLSAIWSDSLQTNFHRLLLEKFP